MFFSGMLLAQNNISIQNDFKNFGSIPNTGTTNLGTGVLSPDAGNSQTSAAISTFSRSDVKGARYLFEQWTPGSVTAYDNSSYSNNYKFNFDKITQNLYAQYEPQGNISVVVDKSKVKRFAIAGLNFVNGSTIDQNNNNLFYQLLVEDSTKISLYKLTKTRFVRANPADMSNMNNKNFSSEFVDDITYFIRYNNVLNKINLTESNVYKVLKSKSDKLNSYFTMHSNKEIDEQFLVGLVKYLNS